MKVSKYELRLRLLRNPRGDQNLSSISGSSHALFFSCEILMRKKVLPFSSAFFKSGLLLTRPFIYYCTLPSKKLGKVEAAGLSRKFSM